MKRTILIFFCAVLLGLLALPAAADTTMTLDEKACFDGMGGKSWYQGYSPRVTGNKMTICLPIRGDALSGNLTAALTLNDPDVYLLRGTPEPVTVSQANGIYPVRLTLDLQSARINGDYPATVRFTGQDTQGNPAEGEMSIVLRIRDGRKNQENPVPSVAVESASLDVGTEGSVTLSLQNPSKTLSMTGLALTVTDSTGDVLMRGSHRLALPELLPGQTRQITVPVTVKGDAAVNFHTLEMKLNYQILEESKDYAESFSLPVTQAIRLEQGGAALAPTAIAGETATLSVPLMNMGKGELRNVMVTLELDGVISRQSVLVGTIAARREQGGSSDLHPARGHRWRPHGNRNHHL